MFTDCGPPCWSPLMLKTACSAAVQAGGAPEGGWDTREKSEVSGRCLEVWLQRLSRESSYLCLFNIFQCNFPLPFPFLALPVLLLTRVCICISLVPRPHPDFILLHGCEIKSGWGMGTRLIKLVIHGYQVPQYWGLLVLDKIVPWFLVVLHQLGLHYLIACLHRPYVIDLESTNGTYVNNQRIEPARYYELKERVWKIYKLKVVGPPFGVVTIVNNIHFCN